MSTLLTLFIATLSLVFGVRWAVLRICRTLPTAEISGSTGMYVQRWHLVWNEKRLMLVVHRFLGRDLDDPHNHSGMSLSLVIGGRGVETYYREDGSVIKTRQRRAGQVVFRGRGVIHRLDSDPRQPLITVFLLLPQGIDWGFFTSSGFVAGADYKKKCGGDKRFSWVRKPAARA